MISEEYEEIVMPWGKFKGTKMGELPVWYLKYLAENVSENNPRDRRICLAADTLYQASLECED